MMFEQCARCGKTISEGDIRYVIRITVVGDDGGMIKEVDYPDVEIERMLTQIENMEPFEMENDVFEERIFILCPNCKRSFLNSPFGARRGGLMEDDDIVGPIQ